MRLLERKLHGSSPLTVKATIAGGLALLLIAVGLGLRWPNAWWRSGPGDGTNFDYSALDANLGSLRDGFVSDVLGSGAFGSRAISRPGVGSHGITRAASRAGVDVRHGFTNDDFEHAYNATSLPFSARTDTTGATRQSDEPTSCFPVGGTAWYRYRAPATIALFADTFGTGRSTSLGVYRGTSTNTLKLIGCDTSVLGNAQVGFRADKGSTYYFQVTATVRGGPTIFDLAAVGPTGIQSLSASGGPADASSVDHPDISGDGRYVAFVSFARNVSPRPPGCGPGLYPENYCVSLYLRDRVTGKTSRLAEQGQPYTSEEGSLMHFAMSADNRYIAFSAYHLIPMEAADGYRDPSDAPEATFSTYVYDRVSGQVELVSRNSAGEPARTNPNAENQAYSKGSYLPSISADGRYVVFNSDADNLGAPKQPGDKLYVYRRDRLTGTTQILSTDATGRPMHGDSCAGSGRNISGDGRYVAWRNNPVPSGVDSVGGYQVYLWDARTGRSRLVSKLRPGAKPLGSYCPSISLDGSRVGLVSLDPLVPEDTNRTPDVYVYQVSTGRLQRVSVTSDGKQTHDPNYSGREHGILGRSVNLSADGRYAVFDSSAPDLAPSAVGSTRHPPHVTRVFLHDNVTGATVLASVSSTGEPLPGDSNMPYISPDGRSVAFMNVGPSRLQNVVVHELSMLR